MQKTFKRVLAVGLSTVMAVSAFSISAAAYNKDYKSETHTVFKHTEQTLAPGVEYYNNYAYSSDGKQMVYYVATADISRDDVVVQTSYLNQYKDKQPGMSKLSEQVAFANTYYTDKENPLYLSDYYNVVAGVNASFYNMQTGQPTGVCYVDGTSFGNTSYPAFFAILKDQDGKQTAIMDDTANVGNYDNIWQAVGGQYWLVRDGADVTADASGSYLTDRHSRTVVGITDDGKVVLMVLDGRQEPFSCGGTMHELAQIMLEAGCKYAMNIDGGGSTTFGSRPEGEDSFRVINRPSDGSERSISSGLIIGSMAAPSNAFDHVTMTVADEYVTPGTSTELTVAGVSSSGASAELPDDITYEVTGGAVVDGVYTAGSETGEVTITAKQGDKTVGTVTVNVVIPDAIDFSSDNFTIPYGKSSELEVVAKYGLNVVKAKASDYTFTLGNDAAGTLDGFTFTAAEESDIAETTVSAALNGTDLTAEAGLIFGKGSEVIFDFEDGTTNGFNLNYSNYNYYLPNSKVFVATKENGQVHSGNYALGLNIDYSNSQESGYQMIALYQGKVSGNVSYYEGALKLGTWIYIPDEYVGLWVRWMAAPITAITEDAETGEKTYTLGSISAQTMDDTAGGTGVVYSFDEPGWHYLWTDLSQYKGMAWRDYYYCMQFYISDRDGASYGYYAKNAHNINGDFTVYMDDITVDYSTVVEDREAPVFSAVKLGDAGPHSNDALTLTNGYVSDGYGKLDLSATVAENTAKSNYSGLDASTAQAYIDGNAVSTSYANGIISAETYDFAEGQHTVKFVICDKAGNRASATRTFSVANVDKAESIKVVAHDPSLDRILHGSLYWVDVVAANAEDVASVTTTLNLDSMSKWELDHMTVADGFEASYEVVDAGDKIVKLTITNNGSNLAGEQALVSIPVRAWYLDNANKKSPLNNSTKAWTYAEFKATNEFWPVATEVRVQQGLAYNAVGERIFFTGENVFVWSESWANNANMVATQEGKDYKAAWDGGHNHTDEPAIINAKDATCTEKGYTGDKFCEECNSIIEWGEEIPATGHSFAIDAADGLMKCTVCGELANEEIDGKLYVDGALANGDIDGVYYVDGVKFNGYKEDNGVYMNYVDGVADGKYTGLVEKDGKHYYSKLGELAGGWFDVDESWYYFDTETLEAVSTYDNGFVTFEFEADGKLVSGKWYTDSKGTKYYYGPDFYHTNAITSKYDMWAEIDGATYCFNYLGYRYENCVYPVCESNAEKYLFSYFDEDGKLIGPANGLTDYNGSTYYLFDGRTAPYYGLVEADGYYYYVNDGGKVVKDMDKYINTANGITVNGEVVEKKTKHFDELGRMVVEKIKNGLVGDYYYENNKKIAYKGLIEVDGFYYYVNDGGKIVKDADKYINTANGITVNGEVVEKKTKHFDENGHMVIDPVKNGLIGDYYYENNKLIAYKGLIKVDGYYYYVNDGGKIVKDADKYVNTTNGLTYADGTPIEKGYQHFDANGHMIVVAPSVNEGLVGEYYYENGKKIAYKGLIYSEGYYYYINDGGKIVKGMRKYVNTTNGLTLPDGTPIEKGYRYFDADGHMEY